MLDNFKHVKSIKSPWLVLHTHATATLIADTQAEGSEESLSTIISSSTSSETFWVMSSRNSWGNAAAQPHSKTSRPISWPLTLQWILLKKSGYKFWFSDLFWPNQNINKSLEFVLPCLPFLPPCTVYFLMPIFLPDILFKLRTEHLPLFLFLVLFYTYSLVIAATNYSPNR